MVHLNADEARMRLNSYAVPMEKIEEIILAFDFKQAVYEQRFDVGTTLHQYVRNPSHSQRSPGMGNWFCIRGASQDGLAIFGGGSGRHLTSFAVQMPFVALEGTASRLAVNWDWVGGGEGGSTQVFVRPRCLGHLIATGPCDPW